MARLGAQQAQNPNGNHGTNMSEGFHNCKLPTANRLSTHILLARGDELFLIGVRNAMVD
jgi:hypothetical protein